MDVCERKKAAVKAASCGNAEGEDVYVGWSVEPLADGSEICMIYFTSSSILKTKTQ